MQKSLGQKLLFAGMSLVILAAIVLAIKNNWPEKSEPLPTAAKVESLPRIAKVGVTQDPHVYFYTIKTMEAMKQAGFTHFLLTTNWTSDNQLVCMDDWSIVAPRVLKKYDGKKVPSLKELLEFETITGEKPCTINTLSAWLQTNPNAVVMMDFSSRVHESMEMIAARIPNFRTQIIPTVQSLDAANTARMLGFEKIAFAPYALLQERPEILANLIISSTPTFAFLRPSYMDVNPSFAPQLTAKGIAVYAYTINTCERLKTATGYGATGILTDTLAPGTCVAQP